MKRISTFSNPVVDFSKPGLQEYLLVANPSEEVNEKVVQEKAYFYNEYKERIAIKTKPHITVANFLATTEMEEVIIRQLQRICGTTNGFTVTLHNYDGFVPHTVYLRVHNEQPFKQLAQRVKLVDQYIAANACPPLKVVTKPHMTIARRLPESSYIKAMGEYSRKKFRASFEVDQLILIKRNHQLDKCKTVGVITFLPPAATLFNQTVIMQNIVNLPGYKENEYLLVLKPHDELYNRIKEVKKEFAEKYKAPAATGGKPHLALLKFQQYEMAEERIVNRLKIIGMGTAPFKIELSNFGSLPAHSIYIAVTTRVPVQALVKNLKGAQQLMKHKDSKPHFIEEPHLTIARKLVPWQYEKAWGEYSSKHFSGRFIADSMLLLKRPVGSMGFQIVQRLAFMNLPVLTRQGDLFG